MECRVRSRWTITGLESLARHPHLVPARLGHARFRVELAGTEPAELGVVGIEHLVGAEVRATPRFAGLLPLDGSRSESAPTLLVQPGTVDVMVGFEPVEAYTTWGERFTFRVTFDCGGERLAVVAETRVIRFAQP